MVDLHFSVEPIDVYGKYFYIIRDKNKKTFNLFSVMAGLSFINAWLSAFYAIMLSANSIYDMSLVMACFSVMLFFIWNGVIKFKAWAYILPATLTILGFLSVIYFKYSISILQIIGIVLYNISALLYIKIRRQFKDREIRTD